MTIQLTVKVAALSPSPTNPRKRFDESAIAELAASIKQVGLLSPILCREIPDGDPTSKAKYEIVAGERRWRAAKLAKLKEIPVIVRELSDDEVVECQVVENLQRVDVDPMDEARCLRALNERMPIGEIAGRIGRTSNYVSRRLKLLSLRGEIQDALEVGEVSLAWAEIAATLAEDMQAQALAALRGYYGPKTAADLRLWIRQRSCSLDSASFDPSDADLLPMAGACNACAYNSANSLFEETEGQTCQHRPCFEAKQKAAIERVCKENGATVFDHQTHRKLRTDEEVPDNAIRVVSEYKNAAFEPGEVFMAVPRDSGQPDKDDRREALREQRLENEYRQRLAEACRDCVPDDLTWSAAGEIVAAFVTTSILPDPSPGKRHRGIPYEGIQPIAEGSDANFAKWSADMPASDAVKLMIAIASRREVPFHDYAQPELRVLSVAAKVLGVDTDHIRKEAGF